MPYYTMLNGIEERVISFAKFLEISREKIRILPEDERKAMRCLELPLGFHKVKCEDLKC